MDPRQRPAATDKKKRGAAASKDNKGCTGSSRSNFRDNLGAYLSSPQAFPASCVIYHSPSFVAIHDRYPKATVHCLLLPRNAALNKLHPFAALDDADFLGAVRAEAARLARLAAAELRRLLGRYSATEAARNAVLDGGPGGSPAPPVEGRDWSREVQVGVHAQPSMNHLHVHVISRDMHSPMLKHRKHYNSFTTAFFVPLDAFPLAEDDGRRRQSGWPERPMACWRCGRTFEKFEKLKDHLEREFDEWKRE